jgi:hypothetical protein
MALMTPEEANEWIRKFISDDDPQEQSPPLVESVARQEKPPLSWADFRAIMVSYCSARKWEIIFGDEDDRSLLIYAHEESPVPSPSSEISEEELQRMEAFILAD